MDLESIRKNYERLPDQKLIYVAQHEANEINPEVREILINEIKKRNLDPNLLLAIEKQISPINETEFINYFNLIKDLPCPYCRSNEKLTAIVTEPHNNLKIGCKNCLLKVLDKASNNAAVGAVIGSGILGIFKTAKKINLNDEMKQNLIAGHTDYIMATFVSHNIGAIEMRKNDKIKLSEYLQSVNGSDDVSPLNFF